MEIQNNHKKSISALGTAVLLAGAILSIPAWQAPKAQGAGYSDCAAYLPRARRINGESVGPDACRLRETVADYEGTAYVRVDLGLSGSVEGYVTKEGDYKEYLTNTPELVFPQAQASNPRQPYLAIAHYEMLRGAAVLLVYPESRRDWNGKLWVTAHGRGRSFKQGQLKIWHNYLDPDAPMAAFNKLQKEMLADGYAVAVTRRTSAEGLGEIIATLSDGTVVDWVAFNDSHALIKDYTRVAEAALEARMGRAPSRTYLYGKSAGARLARGMNYFGRRLNRDSNGERLFDGFLVDDSAAGTWLPVVMENGRDVLLTSADQRKYFAPQIELIHQLYFNVNKHDLPDFVTNSFLVNKYNNARILMEKGLGEKFRAYEIRQLSHDGGSTLPDGRDGKVRILDLSLLMDGVIEVLDNWVEGRIQAPPSMSDTPVIGDANGDGIIENPAIAFPEVACPLGVFFPYPTIGSGQTSFAAFTGEGHEPVDEEGVFVDMNRNDFWDFRETPTEAWQRLGLLQPGERLTRSRYLSCIREAAGRLREPGFFSESTVRHYLERAAQQNLRPRSDRE